MEQRFPKGVERGSLFAVQSPVVDPMDEGGVVPRPLSFHHDTVLPEGFENSIILCCSGKMCGEQTHDDLLVSHPEEAVENGDKSLNQNEIKPGYLYEIDHIHLPSRTPSQLRSIRVAMVCEKTDMDVAVRYPSMESLRAFFDYSTRETHPALDKKFVMSMASATRVLARLVPSEVFSAQKSEEPFWMISSSASESFGDKVNVRHKKSACLSELKGCAMLKWGVRRRVKYLGRHKENEVNHGNAQNSSSSFVDGVEEYHMELAGICQERESIAREKNNGDSDDGFNVIGGDEERENEEEDGGEEDEGKDDDDLENEPDEEEVEVEEEEGEEQEEEEQEQEEEKPKNSDKNLKRKRDSFRSNSAKKPKKEKVEIRKKQKQKKSTKKGKGRSRYKETTLALRDPKDRWSAERYKLAEENLLRVMKAKGATVRKPILRPQLRAEARKKIGDTGLLDHLLKHMAGKLAPGGEDRFRRRHNPDGAMEYWLESADLVNIRKEAGVNDPYWVPPPGWKPGDPPTQDPTCARELKLLKDDISKIKRELELMVTKVKLEEEIGKLRRELEEIVSKKLELNQTISIASSHSDHSQKLDQQLATSWTPSKIEFNDASSVSVENCKKQLMNISNVLKEIEEKMENIRPNMEGRATEYPSLMKLTEEHTKSKPQGVQALIAAGEETSNLAKNQTTAQIEAHPKAAAVAAAEEKAAKRQRLKSGFRICKPQGTFLWPNSNNSSSGKLMSPQMVVQVEVPTPPSVSSSTAAAPPQLPYSQPLLPHHPASLVKPLAEKRAVTISAVSEFQNNDPSAAALINLVNAPTNAVNVAPLVAHLTPTANTDPWQNTAYGSRNATETDPKECNTSTSSATSYISEAGKWLALSTFKLASDESNHG